MIDASIPLLITDLSRRLEEAYGVPPTTLMRQIKTIGRDMPPKYRRLATILAEAEQHMGHPKLSLRVDAAKVAQAHADLTPFLDSQNLDDKRKGRVIGVITTIMVNLLILALIIAFVLAVVDR